MERLQTENCALRTTLRETSINAENLRRTNYLLRSSRYAILSSLDELQGENERIVALCLKRARKFRDLKTAQKRLLKTHCETLRELELLKASHRKLSEQERENSQKLVAMEIRNSQLRVSYSKALAKVETLSKKKSHLLVNFHRVLKEKQSMKKIIKQTERKRNRSPKQDKQVKKSELSQSTCENASITDLQVEADAGSSERVSADLGLCFAEKC